MKKKQHLLCMLLFLLTGISFGQIRNVTLFPNRVNVSGATVTSSALPGSSYYTPYQLGNGAYQPNGSATPYFTIQDRELYNSAGTWVTSLPIYSEPYYEPEYAPTYRRSFSELTKEIAVVPVPGSCGRFYVIYLGFELYGSVWMKAIVNSTNPASIYIESPTSDCRLYPSASVIAGQTGGIAVSRQKANGNYDLYLVWRDQFKQFDVTSSGINYVTSFTPPLMTSPTLTNELELSNDGTKLSWSNNSTLYWYDKQTNSTKTSTLSTRAIGIEFHSTNSNIVFVADGSGTIKKVDFTSTPVVTNLTMPAGWMAYTQLEKDPLGRIYGAYYTSTDINGNPNGKLFYFDQNSTTFTGTTINMYSYVEGGGGLFPGYSLNDQIDGDDYTTFRGVPAITLSSTINSTANNNPNWNSFYNCTPINLAITTTGSQARATLTKIDPTTKNPTGAFSSSTAWGAPSAINTDIRTLFSGYLNNAANYGTYSLVIESKNACNDLTSTTWYLQINAAPTAATVSLQMNDASTPGVPDAPVKTLPGLSFGIYSGSFNINNSSGYISYYSIGIDQVDPSTGAFIRTILAPSNTTVGGSVSSLTAFNLNQLNIPAIASIGWTGGQGFFANKGINNVYKVTVAVGNACPPASSDWSYINMNCYCRLATNSMGTDMQFSAYPNPFDKQLTLKVLAGEKVTLSLINTIGSEAYKKEYSTEETSSGEIVLDTENLPKGMYIYKAEYTGETLTGTVIK